MHSAFVYLVSRMDSGSMELSQNSIQFNQWVHRSDDSGRFDDSIDAPTSDLSEMHHISKSIRHFWSNDTFN